MRSLLSTYQNVYTCLHVGYRLDAVSTTTTSQPEHQQKQQQNVVVDSAAGRNVNNSSTSATRRLFSQVDRLLEGSAEDRERALELLKAKEHQVHIFLCVSR